jgi:hypothetical protein
LGGVGDAGRQGDASCQCTSDARKEIIFFFGWKGRGLKDLLRKLSKWKQSIAHKEAPEIPAGRRKFRQAR